MTLKKKKKHFHHIRKNPYNRILKEEPKEKYLSIITESCSYIYNSFDKRFLVTLLLSNKNTCK